MNSCKVESSLYQVQSGRASWPSIGVMNSFTFFSCEALYLVSNSKGALLVEKGLARNIQSEESKDLQQG